MSTGLEDRVMTLRVPGDAVNCDEAKLYQSKLGEAELCTVAA